MKDKKGQIGIGVIMTVFVAILVGVVLFQVIAQSVGTSVNTVAVENESLTTVVDDTTQYLTDYRALSGVVIYNATSDTLIDPSNYTVTNNVVHDGALSVSILPHYAATTYISAWEVSGTAQPTTYISNSGGRAMANLITIFFALAVMLVALAPVVNGKILELVGR